MKHWKTILKQIIKHENMSPKTHASENILYKLIQLRIKNDPYAAPINRPLATFNLPQSTYKKFGIFF